MMILSTPRSSSSLIRSSSSCSAPCCVVPAEHRVGDRRGLLVDLLAHEPVVAALLGGRQVPVDVVGPCASAGLPSKSVTSTPSRVIVTTWSWPSSRASRVCSMKAATSEARKFSPSPRPTTSGRVAAGGDHPVGVLRVDRDQRERAVQPAAHLLHRLGERAALRERGLEQVRGDLGVGLGEQVVRRPRSSSARSAAKFSMIPLCTSATRPAAPRCGWALRSLGAPWVAHRVCPMPVRRLRQRVLGERLVEVGELAGPLVARRSARRGRGRCPAES